MKMGLRMCLKFLLRIEKNREIKKGKTEDCHILASRRDSGDTPYPVHPSPTEQKQWHGATVLGSRVFVAKMLRNFLQV